MLMGVRLAEWVESFLAFGSGSPGSNPPHRKKLTCYNLNPTPISHTNKHMHIKIKKVVPNKGRIFIKEWIFIVMEIQAYSAPDLILATPTFYQRFFYINIIIYYIVKNVIFDFRAPYRGQAPRLQSPTFVMMK